MKTKAPKLELPFHVVKRNTIPLWKSLLIRLVAIFVAIYLCAILAIVMIDADPFKFIATMFDGAFGTGARIWVFAKDAAILLCIALAITPAFKMRFWNIGAEGQTLIGALAAVAVIIYSQKLPESLAIPEWLLLILMLFAAVLAGAVWGGIPALFKALWGTNETLFTLMMNYVATGLVAYFLLLWTPSGSSVLGQLDKGHLPVIGHENLLLILLVLLLTVGIFVYQKHTKHGYELSVVGESENTAKYVGINVKKVIIRTMLLSGAICGFAGFLIVGALDHSVATTSVGGMGFTAIMVSWLAKFNPLIMIGTSSLITFLDRGAAQVTTTFNVDSSFPNLVVGVVLFFIIGCEFFINYQIKWKDSKITKYSFSMVAHILLSILLSSIWPFIWVFRTTEFTNFAKDKKERDSSLAMLFYIFLPFYNYVWIYKTAKRIDAIAKEYGVESRLASPLLILFFFFPIVAAIMMQIKINTIVKKAKQMPNEGGNEQ